jgi:hypothetical protein
MLVAAVCLLVLLCIALAIARRTTRKERPAPPQPAENWTQAAGDEFSALSEAERCDLIFAVAALDDERCQQLLVRALDDPSEAVALAAARSLARHGGSACLERYLAARCDERGRALRLLVEILQ